MKSTYLERVCGNLGLKRSFVTEYMVPEWWNDGLYNIPSAFAELQLVTERILGMPWRQTEYQADGAEAIAKSALRAFNPYMHAPEYDVPMLGLANASVNVHAFYVHEDPNAAAAVRPVYAVVLTHPRLAVDLREWATAAYLNLPLDRVSREVAAFYGRVSGVKA